jgi:hypothetical protein
MCVRPSRLEFGHADEERRGTDARPVSSPVGDRPFPRVDQGPMPQTEPMNHSDFYVLCGTAFPILLLAFFATDTPLLQAPIFEGHQRLETWLTLGSAFAGLGGCVYALASATDNQVLRAAVIAILFFVTARLVILGVQHHQANAFTDLVETARSMIEQLVATEVGLDQCRVYMRGGAFYVEVDYELPADFKEVVQRFADQVDMRIHWI